MKIIDTQISDVLIFETDIFKDNRGLFTESYNYTRYRILCSQNLLQHFDNTEQQTNYIQIVLYSFCTDLELDWSDELLPGSSSIFNNQFCPPYSECIEPFMGVQDTSNCFQAESP